MQNGHLESLLNKAEDLEKRYEWFQAAEFCKKATDVSLKEKDSLKAAELQERMGFCFFRAAFQAQTNIEFKKLLKQAIQTYEKEIQILEEAKEGDNQTRINHANALIFNTRSWLETNPSEKKRLLDKWWRIENQLLSAYDQVGDVYSVGRTCNGLIELSHDMFFLGSDFSEREKLFKEATCLGEKAIQIFSELDDKYELARAYCFASWYYGFSKRFFSDEDKILQLAQKCQDYSKKALELSQKTGDAWLIGRSYHSAWGTTTISNADPASNVEIGKNIMKYGNISKDNFVMGFGNCLTSSSVILAALQLEDPDKQKETFEKALKLAREASHNFQIIDEVAGLAMSYQFHSAALTDLASIDTDPKTKQAKLEMATKVAEEAIELMKDWKLLYGQPYFYLSLNLWALSGTKTDLVEKRALLQRAQSYLEKRVTFWEETSPPRKPVPAGNYFNLARVQSGLANLERNAIEKISLLNNAVISIEKGIEIIHKRQKRLQSAWASGVLFGRYHDILGGILKQIYSLTKEKKRLDKAIEAYDKASTYFKKAEMPTHVAESYWHAAQLNDKQGKHQEASQNYDLASEAYSLAAEKIPQLKQFYKDYSLYMQAWSKIETARYNHSIEYYEEARQHYEAAAKLHGLTSSWSYLTSNYFAWAGMEEAESLSRKENTLLAKQTFQKAYEQFCNAEESFKQKLEEITSSDEKEMTQKLFKASGLRRKYCQARILLEDAKLLEREGKYLQSSRDYGKAAQNISAILDKIDVEAEHKELEYLAMLCQAWEKMAVAEETTSSESYLEAAALFEQAKEHCYTKKASLWALGNSNFCRGLAAGVQYQTSLDLADHAKAKGYIKNASTNYLQAGFKNASEYAKATQRLFDAYVFINQAEGEIDQEKRAKQYQMAENLLQISAGSFMKARQPEKTAQVQQILKSVREEKALAVSLNQVIHAPTIASSTLSFTAPTPTNEMSVGLEGFQHANVQANLVTNVKEVRVGESFCLAVEFVNAGREPALLMRVEDFVPPDFSAVKKPEIYRIEETCLNMKGKQLAPLKLVEVKLTLQPSKKGEYQLNPRVHYLDELGQKKSLQLRSIDIKVEEVILADRVSTGTKELDSLLLGGIPEGYAVVLTGPPSDERESIIKSFLETGIKQDQVTFQVTAEPTGLENLLEKSGFYLFLCNPKPKVEVPDLPNIHKLSSKTDLNNLNIALTVASRSLDQKLHGPKRICMEIISDVLIRHQIEVTQRWISELIADMGSKGFTLLAVMDPSSHPPDQANAILNLFDGTISLFETETATECKTSIQIKRLRNQDYIKNQICITK